MRRGEPRPLGQCCECGRKMLMFAKGMCKTCYDHHNLEDNCKLTDAQLDALIESRRATMPQERTDINLKLGTDTAWQRRRGLEVRLVRRNKHWAGVGVMG